MTPSNKIIIIEKNPLVREGLRLLISSKEDMEIIGQAKDGEEAVKLTQELMPELVVMDLGIPYTKGLSALHAIKRQCPGVKVLIVSAYESEEPMRASLKAGGDGYLSKEESPDELLIAIRTVLTGEVYLDPTARRHVLEGYLRSSKRVGEVITKREQQVIGLLCEGFRNPEIAKELDISAKTVEKHRANLMRKLDIHDLPALISFAFRHGITMLPERRTPRPSK